MSAPPRICQSHDLANAGSEQVHPAGFQGITAVEQSAEIQCVRVLSNSAVSRVVPLEERHRRLFIFQCGEIMAIIREHLLIEQILEEWKSHIGPAYEGYRGHVYRVLNYCRALRDCSDDETQKLAIAAAFHDLGLWSDHTVDYLPPSEDRARKWLVANGFASWQDEIGLIIRLHHRIRPVRQSQQALVELFRRADLIDFSLGLIRFGVPARFISRMKSEIPNQGFHWFLVRTATSWILRHPLRPLPFLKW